MVPLPFRKRSIQVVAHTLKWPSGLVCLATCVKTKIIQAWDTSALNNIFRYNFLIREVRQESPIPSEVFVGNVSSPSSVTPTWWSEPSSRHLSTSGTEVEVNPRGKCHVREGGQQSGTNDEEVKSKPKNNRKRLRWV